jgi:hypothetical protein
VNHDEIKALAKLATQGDRAAARTLLESEHGAGLTEEFGNAAGRAETALLKAMCARDRLSEEALRRNLTALRQELAGPDPSPLERLLAEQVALCWLESYHATIRAAQYGDSRTRGGFYQHRLDRAQARYLAAMKALATMRKLLRPAPTPLEVAARTVEETTGEAAARDFRRPALVN